MFAWSASRVQADGACCLPGDACQPSASETSCEASGGVYLDGADCADQPCEIGACCAEFSCAQSDAYTCVINGRNFGGAGTTCLDDPCEDGVGACCNDGTCLLISPEVCDQEGGVWLGAGTNCIVDQCVLGACCQPGTCEVAAEYECSLVDGFFAEGLICDGAGCEQDYGCPGNALFGQSPESPNFSGYYLSELAQGLARLENFADVPGAVEGLRWFGLSVTPVGNSFDVCDEISDDFEITFFSDELGEPGSVVCQQTITAVRSDTGMAFDDISIFEFNATLETPCALTRGWVSIVGLGDPQCLFFWASSAQGDDQHRCPDCQGPFIADDLSVCLLGSAGGVSGACCDEADGSCTDDEDIASCQGIGVRFAAGESCDELQPPCQQSLGACCRVDSTCDVLAQAECVASNEQWLGPDTTCEDCPPRGACCLDVDVCFENVTDVDCAALGYTWGGEGSSCDNCLVLPECPADSLVAQAPQGPGGFLARASELSANGRLASKFEDVAGATSGLTWWGFDLEPIPGSGSFLDCSESDPTFEITFFDDFGGLPGDVVCSYTLTADVVRLGINYLGTELNEYNVELPEPCLLTDGWVQIVGLGDPGCWFLWIDSPDGISYCNICTPTTPNDGLAICQRGVPGGFSGACCDDQSGICEDGVDVEECVANNGRFAVDVTCSELEPDCGVVFGVCCENAGVCEFVDESTCLAEAGQWLGPDGFCFDCPCSLPCRNGSVSEGETTCSSGYVDEFNAGCDAEPNMFSPIEICDTVCGESGTFDAPGGKATGFDSDWYEIVLTEPAVLTWTVTAEFPVVSGAKGRPLWL
ncbi:MAG: hypothetical protein ACYTHJ_18340 [Planctomycetota bacterium]